MTLSGTVTASGAGVVAVEVLGQNDKWGMHVTAPADIALAV